MTHRIWNSIKGLSVVCAASLGYQASAQAQDAPAPESSGKALEEVVVTAQRRAEAVNDIGMAIQAIDTSKLEQLAVSDVRDLTAVVPSFNVSQAFTGVPTYTLRGIGFNTINISATSTVGTYVDEAAYAYPIMNTGPLFDLDRVEVLKGPQGTLYGRNSTAGLINFISAKPTKDFQAEASADVGNFETLNAGGFVSGPLPFFGDVVQGRLAFRVENSGEGWQESVSTGQEQGEIEKYGVRGSLALQPFDSTKLDLSVNWFKNRSGTVVGQAIAFTPATDPALPFNPAVPATLARLLNVPNLQNFVTNNFPDEAEDADFSDRATRSMTVGLAPGLDGPLREGTEFTGFKLRLDQDLTDNLRLVSLTNYNRLERDTLSDFGGVPSLGAPVAPAFLGGGPVGLSDQLLVQNTIGNIDSFAEDLHLEGKFGEVNYLVGGYYANDRILDSNLTLLGGNANTSLVRFATLQLLNTPANDQGFTQQDVLAAFRLFSDFGEIKTESWSVFANADAPLTDQLKLSGGVRYTEEEQDYKGCSLDVNGNLLPTVNTFNRFMFVNTNDPRLPAFGQPMPAPVQANGCVTYNPVTNSFGLVRSTLDQNNVAARAALDYKPTDGVLLYASLSQGSKAGTTPINAANISTQNAPVGQERLRAYEVGTKSTLFGRTVQANVSGFYYDYKDKQLNTFFADPIFTALARLDNIPESHVYGLETDVTWRATDGLTLNATFLALETEIDKYIGTNSAGVDGIDFSGSQFNFSPKFQGSLSAFYSLPVGPQYLVTAALNARAQSKSRAIIGEEEQTAYNIPGYGVVNGSVGFGTEDGKWNVALFGRNLLDKYFFNSVVNSANTIVRFANPPRQFGATLTYKFN